MRKQQKKQAEDFIKILGEAHEEIKKYVLSKQYEIAMDLLGQCQEGAVKLGELIENTEGEECITISLLEGYCEMLYHVYEDLQNGAEINVNNLYKKLRKSLIQIENSVKNDIPTRLEVAFFPYKASMWDSLESVYLAAKDDPNCDAYCVPIPYYDITSDGRLGQMHYEGNDYPEDIEITNWETYKFEDRRPDVIYFHNPYDNWNRVTTVHPRYYSDNLKKYTDTLVYIPYYATSGGMGEGQRMLPAYVNADYIVIQAESYRNFFDASIPDEKFLPLGSPKFDRVIRLCNNPPEIPSEWKEKIYDKDGNKKKVYFYNTSISGMLQDTEKFLKKMQYVFSQFEGRKDVCILWRPHPLLESTFDSMRREYKPIYDEIKRKFIESGMGIFDNTPDIGASIAWSDTYIGDAGTSVPSLFGIAGKPIFILNNDLDKEPEEGDWRGEIIRGFFPDGNDDWMITQGNNLYHAPNHDYQYEFYCNLSEYSGSYYLRAIELDDTVYVCPSYAQDILIIENKKIVKRIVLEQHTEQVGAFYGAIQIGQYIFLLPAKYPAFVRYDTKNDKVDYIKGYTDGYAKVVNGEWIVGGSCVWKQYLLLGFPNSNQIVQINSDTLEIATHIIDDMEANVGGCCVLVPDGDDIWILPYTGITIRKWNPMTNAVKIYTGVPEHFQCTNRFLKSPCIDRPFNMAACTEKYVILSPLWVNMFVKIDKTSGSIEEWQPNKKMIPEGLNCYFPTWDIGTFIRKINEETYRYYYTPERKLYDVNLWTGLFTEILICFNYEELKEHESGFCDWTEWFRYVCYENSFQSIKGLLDDNLYGNRFHKEEQIESYKMINANDDGTCGIEVYKLSIKKV